MAILTETRAVDPKDVSTTLPTASVALLEGVSEERLTQEFQEVVLRKPLPIGLIQKYAKLAVKLATVKQHPDGHWFAEIPRFQGVWAKEASAKESLEVLEDVLFDWFLLKIQDGDRDLPAIETIDLNVL